MSLLSQISVWLQSVAGDALAAAWPASEAAASAVWALEVGGVRAGQIAVAAGAVWLLYSCVMWCTGLRSAAEKKWTKPRRHAPPRGGEASAAPPTSKPDPAASAPKDGITRAEAKRLAAAGKRRGAGDGPRHPLLVATGKGHTGTMTAVCVSPCASIIATASDDGVVRMSNVAALASGGQRYQHFELEGAHASALGMASGARLLAIVTFPARMVAVYNVSPLLESKPELRCSWPSGHKQPVLTIAVPTRSGDTHGATGAALTYVVTCGASDDIFVRVWSINGETLSAFNTHQVQHLGFSVSLDGRFMAVATWTTEVKIWELRVARGGTFVGLDKAMSLRAHTQRVLTVSLSADGRKAVTVGADRKLCVWSTEVRYSMQEDPVLLHTSPCEQYTQICMSCEARIARVGARDFKARAAGGEFAVATAGAAIDFIRLSDGSIVVSIPLAAEGGVASLVLTSDDAYVVSRSTFSKTVLLWAVPQELRAKH